MTPMLTCTAASAVSTPVSVSSLDSLSDSAAVPVLQESETLKSQQLHKLELKQGESSMNLVSSIVQDGQAKAVLQEVYFFIRF